MKVLLMHRERGFDAGQAPPPDERALIEDLGLETLLGAMAGGDEFVRAVANRALLPGTQATRDDVLYRQRVLRDCLKNAGLVRTLYQLAGQAIEGRRKHFYGYLSNFPGSILSGSIGLMEFLVGMLRQLRDAAEANAGRFASEGFSELLAMLRRELGEEYLRQLDSDLRELRFGRGVLVSARLGPGGGASIDHMLRKPRWAPGGWLQRLLRRGPAGFSFRLHERDEAGARIVSDLRNRGLNHVANALAQSAEHVLGFFEALRTELAFYVGCLNLHARLSALSIPLAFPEPADGRALGFAGLRDAPMALHLERAPVDNSLDADGRDIVLITGPNQGGKSSFLRALGAAQLMMQCGMYVAAERYRASICAGLFTHYKREEDASMKCGKFDEELARMDRIVERLAPDSLVLFNESFGATNEREGSEIARQIVRALLEKRVRIVFVTHLYEFAHAMFERNCGEALFLRAERKPDGTRTFRLLEGEPLETSYGADVYRVVFGEDPPAARRAVG